MLLVLFGLFALFSATTAVAFTSHGDKYYFLKRQLLLGVLPGLACLFLVLRLPYGALKRLARISFFFALILLVLVYIPGIRASFGTARSWIVLGGFSLQPSELMKVALALFLALWFERRDAEDIESVRYGVLPFLGWVGLVAALIALQPDIGTLAVVLALSFSIFFAAGARLKHVVVLTLLGATAFSVLVVSSPYRLARLTTFLHPEQDPQGAGYQINQALLAIGSGGFLGQGVGQSRQKFQYLPEVASDSIFAVIAEELGFVGSSGVVILILIVALRMISIAGRAPDIFGKLVVVGVGGWFVVQSFLNIGAMVGLLPITGVPLPLVSHGGTAMLAALIGVGIVAKVSQHSKKT